MTDRSSRDTEYVIIRNPKPRKPTRHYYDADDDDNDSQLGTTTRRIVRTKPSKEQRIRYVTADELDSDYRRPRVAESSDHRVKVRHTTNGEQVILDEDNNVIKIIRNSRPPTPPYVENRRLRIRRPPEPQTLYYETSDGQLITRPSKKPTLTRTKNDFVYAEHEPTKILRKIIVDPRTGDRQTIYEKDKPKKQVQQKYIIRKQPIELPPDSDNEYEQEQPQYVQVVQQRTVPKQEAPPTTKYTMIRKKTDSEPVYAISPSNPSVKSNRRIVYESPTKKSSNTYVYSTNGKYYK